MKDRVVQYPSRYQLVPVAGTTDQFDLVAVPGIVTAAGTDLNKANLLKDATAALFGLSNTAVPDEVFNQIHSNLLYEKIRDISDTSATGSLSVDLSNIDWSLYREIRLICDLKQSTPAYIYPRINSVSTASYYYSVINYSGSITGGSTATSMLGSEFYVGNPDIGAQLDISISKQMVGTDTCFCWKFNRIATQGGMKFGSGSLVISSLSTFNLVSANAAYTVYLKNASLWGVKR